jgi:hypothetical protein
MTRKPTDPMRSVSLRIRVCHSNTRIVVRLLGPCFKTGRLRPFRGRDPCGPTCHLESLVSQEDYNATVRKDRATFPPVFSKSLKERPRAPCPNTVPEGAAQGQRASLVSIVSLLTISRTF